MKCSWWNMSVDLKVEELLTALQDCVENDYYFEIDSADAKILLSYILELEYDLDRAGDQREG